MSDFPSRLERLQAMRDTIETALAMELPARDLAAISREYRALLAEIHELEPKQVEGDPVDEIAARRAARRSGASPRSRRSKRAG